MYFAFTQKYQQSAAMTQRNLGGGLVYVVGQTILRLLTRWQVNDKWAQREKLHILFVQYFLQSFRSAIVNVQILFYRYQTDQQRFPKIFDNKNERQKTTFRSNFGHFQVNSKNVTMKIHMRVRSGKYFGSVNGQ